MIKVTVSGAAGRMGRTILSLLKAEKVDLAAALEHASHQLVGTDLDRLTDGIIKEKSIISDAKIAVNLADVIIDFSSADNTMQLVELCVASRKPMVIGTTGLSEKDKQQLQEASKMIPMLVSPNMAVGVNTLFALVEQAAKLLKEGFDVEISEIHHHFKKDAPSGTAVRLKEIVQHEHSTDEGRIIYGRHGLVGERPMSEIGVHALRGGDVVGEHTVYFFADGERVELTHRATSRVIFARGALRAAKFLVSQKPGWYSMMDVLNQ
ncbi:MAG: 4-hydroxy-tetrahydrodipicolinate reductase [Leptonema sp. (in: Bacteria)]|nr:4-hydroxy-tetrahydrodipicolinate reductase [Leptonema sp. (in: bacteria)]